MFLTASAVVVWLTHLSWLPCAGSMLRGTPFDSAQQADFSEACLRAMDSSVGFPLATWLERPQQLVNALNAAALVLLGLGWLALVRSWGHPGKTWRWPLRRAC